MKLYYDMYQIMTLFDASCKVCVSILSARLLLLISKWVKAAYRERNEWEAVEEVQDDE